MSANYFDKYKGDQTANYFDKYKGIETTTAPASNKGAFVSTLKSTGAHMLNSALGQPIEDIGSGLNSLGLQQFGKGVRQYAEGVQKDNPSQINSLSDVVDQPVNAVKTALGNVIPQVPASLGSAWAGAKLGASLPLPPQGKAVAGVVGGLAGLFAPSYLQEYTEMRGKQHETGQEDITKALGYAVPAAASEVVLDKVLLGGSKFLPKGLRNATPDIIPAGASRAGHVAKQVAKGVGVEAGQEYGQTHLEQLGGNQDTSTQQAADERNVSAALGGIGGGIVKGGVSAFDPRASVPDTENGDQQSAQRRVSPLTGEPVPEVTLESGGLVRALAAGAVPADQENSQISTKIPSQEVINGAEQLANNLYGNETGGDETHAAANVPLSDEVLDGNRAGNRSVRENLDEASRPVLSGEGAEQRPVQPGAGAGTQDNRDAGTDTEATLNPFAAQTPSSLQEAVNGDPEHPREKQPANAENAPDHPGAFVPTHELNDGTPVVKIDDNTFVDAHNDEWQADDATPITKSTNVVADTRRTAGAVDGGNPASAQDNTQDATPSGYSNPVPNTTALSHDHTEATNQKVTATQPESSSNTNTDTARTVEAGARQAEGQSVEAVNQGSSSDLIGEGIIDRAKSLLSNAHITPYQKDRIESGLDSAEKGNGHAGLERDVPVVEDFVANKQAAKPVETAGPQTGLAAVGSTWNGEHGPRKVEKIEGNRAFISTNGNTKTLDVAPVHEVQQLKLEARHRTVNVLSSKNDKPFSTEKMAQLQVQRLKHNPDDFEIKPVEGGFVAVRKVTEAQAIKQPSNTQATETKSKSEKIGIDELIAVATEQGRGGNQAFNVYRKVDQKEAGALNAILKNDVTDYEHSIDESAIRHILSQHGDEVTEAKRGQVAITHEDFKKIPEITHALTADSVEYGGKTEDGLDKVVYKKRYNGHIIVVEEVRNRRGKLALKTMWKTRAAPSTTSEEALSPTSETFRPRSPTGEESITQADKNATPGREGQFKNKTPLWERTGPSTSLDKQALLIPEAKAGVESIPQADKSASTSTPSTQAEDVSKKGEKIDVSEKGDFGPIYRQFKHDVKGAIEHLTKLKNGEAIAALHHPDVGDIDLVWGKEGTSKSDGYGLAKLVKYHPEVVGNLQGIISGLSKNEETSTARRVQLESKDHKAAVRLEWDGKQKHWLLTAFEKRAGDSTRTDIADIDGRDDTARSSSSSESSITQAPKSTSEDNSKPEASDFVSAPDGSKDFGEITQAIAQEIKRQHGKIKLQVGEHLGKNKGYGIVHIQEGHPEIKNPVEFVKRVVSNFSEIWKTKGGRLILVNRGTDKTGDVSIVQLVPSESGDFYSVVTAYKSRNPEGETLLWDAAHSHPADSGIQPALHSQHHKASDAEKSAKQKEGVESITQSPKSASQSDADTKLSKSQQAVTNPHTKTSLMTAMQKVMDKAYGDKWFERLQATGKFKVIDAAEAGGINSAAASAQGFYDPATDTSYVVADNIGHEDNIKSILLHEIGTHTLTLGRSDAEFQNILKHLETLNKLGNAKVKEAFERVPKDTHPDHVWEEVAAYLVMKHPSLPISRKIIAWFRNAIRAIGKALPPLERMKFFRWAADLNEEDIVFMANAALRSAPDSLLFDQVGRNDKSIMASKSAMKSVTANIKRGREAMTKALLGKTTVHRAMFRPGMGWVDFEYGSEGGKVTQKGKRPGAKGIAHILEARQRKDGLSEVDAKKLLFKLVDTIAKGSEIALSELSGITRATINDGKREAILVKRPGSNSWMLTGYEDNTVDTSAGGDALVSTRPESTPARNGTGAAEDKIPQPKESSSDIKFSIAGPQSATTHSNASNSSKWFSSFLNKKNLDTAIYNLQDRYIDLKRQMEKVVKNGGTIQEVEDPRLGEELYHQRTASRIKSFYSDEFSPILQSLHKHDVSMAQFQTFLHARHAPSRNKVMAERNPNQAMIDTKLADAEQALDDLRNDPQATAKKISEASREVSKWSRAKPFKGTEDERLALSGMSDQQAADHMASLTPMQKLNMDVLGKRIDKINNETLDLMVAYGMETPQSIKALKDQWDFYVPLHRDEAHPDDNNFGHPVGSGFSVKGSGMKNATGSNAQVTNIMAHIAAAREQMLKRGEKNLVQMRLAGFIANHPDADFAEVGKVPTLDYLVNGLVETLPDPIFKNRDNVVMMRVKGKDVAIVFNDKQPENVRLALSLKNMDGVNLDQVESIIAKGTRWLASVNTQYNVVFGVMNLIRDTQGAMLGLSSTPLHGKQAKVFGNMGNALKVVSAVERGWTGADPTLKAMYERFNKAGGTTGYSQMFEGVADRDKSIQNELDKLAAGKAGQSWEWIKKSLSDFNTVMENSTRLATFMTAVDAGLSDEKAASIAKNITVNFNRKGSYTTKLGAFYAFFNASMQGTARLAETMAGPKGKQILTGGVALGAMTTLLGLAALGDDEWEKIPEFVRERSLIFPAPWNDSGYIAIPMPLGFHVLPNIGRKFVESAFGSKRVSPQQRLLQLAGSAVGAFNPLGGADISSMVMPTVLDPALALWRNKDFTGRTIYQSDFNSLNPTPGFTRTKDTATDAAKLAAEVINKATGGTDAKQGLWSPTPDQIDYVIGQLLGGTGREIMKAEQAAASLVTGDELPVHKIPLLGRVYGETQGAASESQSYYDNLIRLNEHQAEVKYLREHGKGGEVSTYMTEHPEARLTVLADSVERNVKKLKHRRELLKDRDAGSGQIKLVDGQITAQMQRLNDRVISAMQ